MDYRRHFYYKTGIVSLMLWLCPAVQQRVDGVTTLSLGAGGPLQLSERSIKAKRDDKQYVVLSTYFSDFELGEISLNVISNFLIGIDKQPIKLVVTPQHVTWVPHEPDSISQFCPSTAETRRACKIGGNYGYYTQKEPVRFNPFTFNESYNAESNLNATGNWIEDKVTAGDIEISLQFGLAQIWHSSPLLGLGIHPTNRDPKRPSYLEALVAQGKIATGRFASFYNIMDIGGPGEIVLGGVDREKFIGELEIWEARKHTGDVDAPGVTIDSFLGTTGPFNTTGIPLAAIDPSARSIFVPRSIYTEMLNTTEPYGLKKNMAGEWCLPCNVSIPEETAVTFWFNKTGIRVPFKDLILLIPSPKNDDSADLCQLRFWPTDDYLDVKTQWSFIFGGPFFSSAYVIFSPDKNLTAIANIQRNKTTQDIVPVGGSFVELSKIQGNFDSTPSPAPVPGGRPNIGAYVGGSLAGTIVLLVVAGILIHLWRKRQREMPNIPPPEQQVSYPRELDGKQKERNLIDSAPVLELSSGWPPELEAQINR
ncbi:hypothetical protein H072_6913 [Dactylellina haptotyla CBS 200.50]|uniref:Peptidase A1 domain-containing protein n=1 Tax=Dactylellina haptotyla (strain CBS 200.50) TaxID=1284197 RepID=S8ADX9_DACHA|nr:hypothetical protein H072_6913 [Dactylellina haptotyla CBS 200.50]